MDEHDDVGPVASVSEPAGSVPETRGDETLTGDLGCEEQIVGPFSGEDSGEIMVEVVGSDVFVDGVGGDGHDHVPSGGGDLGGVGSGDGFGKEGLEPEIRNFDRGVKDLVALEVGDLGGQVRDRASETGIEGFRDAAAGSSGEQAHHVIAEGVESVAGSSCDQTEVVVEKVEAIVREADTNGRPIEHDMKTAGQSVDGMGHMSQGVGVLDNEAWNPGIEDAAECSFVVEESSHVQTQVVTVKVPTTIEGEDLTCKDELRGSNAMEANLTSSEKDQISNFEMACSVTDKDGVSHANAEFLDQRAKGIIQEEIGVMNTEDTSDSKVGAIEIGVSDEKVCSVECQKMKVETTGTSALGHSNLDVDSLSSCEMTRAVSADEVAAVANISGNPVVDDPQNVVVGGTGHDVGKVCTDPATRIEQIRVDEGYSGVVDSKDSVSDTGTQVSCGEVFASENGVSAGYQEFTPDGMNESSKTNVAVCAEPESSGVSYQAGTNNEVTVTDNEISRPILEASKADGKYVFLPCHKNARNLKCEIKCGGAGNDGVIHADPEQACAAEREAVVGVNTEEVFDFKDETPGFDALGGSLSCSGEDQYSKVENADEKSENDMAHAHQEAPGELIQVADRCDTPAVDKEVVTEFDGEAEMKDYQAVLDDQMADSPRIILCESEVDENLKAAVSEGSTGNEAFIQDDCVTSVGHILVAGEEAAMMDDKKVSDSRTEVLTGHTCFPKDQKLNTLITGSPEKGSVFLVNEKSSGQQNETERQVESSATECQSIVDVPAWVEPTGISAAQDTVCNDPYLVAEVRDHSTTIRMNSETLEDITAEDANIEAINQSPETLTDVEDRGQNRNPLNEVLSNRDSVTAVSDSVVKVTAGSQSAPNIAFHGGDPTRGNLVSDVTTSSEVVDPGIEGNDESCKTNEHEDMDAYAPELEVANVRHEVEVGNQYLDVEHVDLHGAQDIEIEENKLDADQSEATFTTGNHEGVRQSSYPLPPESDGEFHVSDLVWGKVRSHPWWPGQIFDPEDASEKAVKYHKKDCFLVAYFGDRTFAWNDAPLLKPFWSHFSLIEKQSNSEAFHNAVSCALEEVSRRVELGLVCSCVPKDECDKIGFQIVENTGIRPESSRRYGVDKSTGVSYFEPDKLLEYIRALAQSPFGGSDRLEVVIAKALLMAFCRFKGYRQVPEFQFCGVVLENDADILQLSGSIQQASTVFKDGEQILSSKGNLKGENESSLKRKNHFNDDVYPCKKERSLSELMGEVPYSSDNEECPDGQVLNNSVSSSSGKKRMAVDFVADGADRRANINAAIVSTTASPIPKPSFKVGDCIRRVASQLTGPPSILKNNCDFDNSMQTPDSSQRGRIPMEYSSLDQMLSQLHLAARDPMKGYSFLNIITDFFSGFRNSIILNQRSGRQKGSGRKRKASQAAIGSSEDFEFDDVNDSYWTDRIVQNYSAEQLLHNGENREEEYQMVAYDPDKSLKSHRRSHSRKRYSSGNHEMVVEKPIDFVDEAKQDSSPAELILKFAEGDSVPSEVNLNKIFRRFGPLKEIDTEVDTETGRARVVFKKGSDAKVAFSSAGKFNIFGPKLVNYDLNFSPSVSYKVLPLVISQVPEDAT